MIFKIVNYYNSKNQLSTEKADGSIQEDIEKEPENQAQSSGDLKEYLSYFECILILINLIIIYSITKLKISRINYVMYGLIMMMNMLNIVKIQINDVDMFFDMRFFFTIAFSFGCRLSSFFYVSAVCTFALAIYLNVSIGTIIKD